VKQSKGKGRKEGEGSADRWGPGVSGCGGKRKEGADVGRCGRKVGGPWAGWAEKVREILFFVFLFFSNSFQNQIFFNSNSFQNFSNFFSTFYKIFRPHTSNQKPCIAK
jgi:hypothetical protein